MIPSQMASTLSGILNPDSFREPVGLTLPMAWAVPDFYFHLFKNDSRIDPLVHAKVQEIIC